MQPERDSVRQGKLELVLKVSSAAVDHMRADTSSNFAKSSVYLGGYTSGFSSFSSSYLASRRPGDEANFETSSSWFCCGRDRSGSDQKSQTRGLIAFNHLKKTEWFVLRLE
jgi:hypothetical protein